MAGVPPAYVMERIILFIVDDAEDLNRVYNRSVLFGDGSDIKYVGAGGDRLMLLLGASGRGGVSAGGAASPGWGVARKPSGGGKP
jgi:hypothetical protein